MIHLSMDRRALTSILSVSSVLRRGLIARASSGGNSWGGASVGASRGMTLVPLDFLDMIVGRESLARLGVSSVSVEAVEVDCEEGGLVMFTVGDSTIDGMAEEVRKGSSTSEDIIDAIVIQRTLRKALARELSELRPSPGYSCVSVLCKIRTCYLGCLS